MKYFVAVEEDLLQRLWIKDPSLVVPFSRPFYPGELRDCSLEVNVTEHLLTVSAPKTDESNPQLCLPGFQEKSALLEKDS